MAKRKIIGLLVIGVFVLSILIACGQSLRSTASTEVQSQTSAASTDIVVTAATTTTVVHSADHEDATDYAWDSAAVIPITLQGDSITVDGDGATVEGSQVTISAPGTYSISGSLTDGQIIVDTQDAELVRLILNGVNIHSATSAPIAVMDAAETIIWLADNTENFLTDGDAYVFADPAEDEPNAALFSKSALTIAGSGSLTVVGNYNDGIASKDGLITIELKSPLHRQSMCYAAVTWVVQADCKSGVFVNSGKATPFKFGAQGPRILAKVHTIYKQEFLHN